MIPAIKLTRSGKQSCNFKNKLDSLLSAIKSVTTNLVTHIMASRPKRQLKANVRLGLSREKNDCRVGILYPEVTTQVTAKRNCCGNTQVTKRNLAGSQNKHDAQLTVEREDLELQDPEVTTQVTANKHDGTTQVTAEKNRCGKTQVTKRNLAGSQNKHDAQLTVLAL